MLLQIRIYYAGNLGLQVGTLGLQVGELTGHGPQELASALTGSFFVKHSIIVFTSICNKVFSKLYKRIILNKRRSFNSTELIGHTSIDCDRTIMCPQIHLDHSKCHQKDYKYSTMVYSGMKRYSNQVYNQSRRI